MKPAISATALAVALLALPAAAFELEEGTTEENSVEMEISNSVFLGDVDNGDDRSTHEVGVTWGLLHGWSTGLAFELTNEAGGEIAFEGVEWSNTIAILGGETERGPEGLTLALFTAFEFEFEESDDVELTIGPAIGIELDPIELTVNPFVTVPLGGGSDAGFTYALGAYYEVSDDLAVGIEAHGEIEDAFSNAPGLSQQEHFIGPAIAFEIEAEEDREVEFRLGSFFGLTEATPTVGLSLNLELGF